MGIKQLSKLIGDNASAASKEVDLGSYFSRKVAVDASMSMYQFLIAMQRPDGTNMLTNDAGEVTSHLNGLMMRTAKMLENNIKPVYVFDGKPPDLKKGTLDDRKEKREEADAALAKAREEGDDEAVEKFAKRTVRVSREMTEDAKTLLRLMGVPVIEAPTEAEAQCAILAKAGIVHAAVSEDMDTLTFGAPVMLRNVFIPESRKIPIMEITLDRVLEGLGIDMTQFIHLCILMGCDYCGTIKGVGQKRALELIQKHKSIDNVIKALDLEKHPLPETFNFEEIAEFFHSPEVSDPAELEAAGMFVWKDCDEDGLRKFMVDDKQFNKDRVEQVINRLKKARGTSAQQRLDGFFKVLPGQPKKDAGRCTQKWRGGLFVCCGGGSTLQCMIATQIMAQQRRHVHGHGTWPRLYSENAAVDGDKALTKMAVAMTRMATAGNKRPSPNSASGSNKKGKTAGKAGGGRKGK